MKKLTHEEFLINWKLKVKNPNYKIIGKYINSRVPILIEDDYGKCLTNPNNLLKGFIPSIQTAIDKTNYCINRFKKIHKNNYIYNKVIYKNDTEKVIITCKKHGDFKQTPHAHLQGQGCRECRRYSRLDWVRSNTKTFIKKATKIHNNKYNYSKVDYKQSKKKVIIGCKNHGDFTQTPNSHLKGRGCYKCYLENNGYNKNKFTYFAKNRTSMLYLIECSNSDEIFIKVGITSRNLTQRFYGDNKLPYKYKLLLMIKNNDPNIIWNKEIEVKRKFKKFKYIPKLKFKGYTECFAPEYTEEIYNYINNLKK